MKPIKATAISSVAPKGAESNPALTPELQASVLAKFSRSNDGLDKILSKVDLDNPEASIANILKFVDYGHASIGGLTGGIAVVLDNVSMYMAYKLFELSPMSDGQESSTRYITMTEESLPDWEALGFTPEQAATLGSWSRLGLQLYDKAYKLLDAQAAANPTVVRIPAKLADKPKAVDRLRKNYALDRARYFLPFGLLTNIGIVQSARMSTETLSGLYSLGIPEAVRIADAIKEALLPYAPNLMRHARAKGGWKHHQAVDQTSFGAGRLAPMPSVDEKGPDFWKQLEGQMERNHQPAIPRGVYVDFNAAAFADDRLIAAAIGHRENRYDRCGIAARDTSIRVTWKDCMAIAELRDLNRHRTGSRFSPLNHAGFYLPEETKAILTEDDLEHWATQTAKVQEIAESLDMSPYSAFSHMVSLRPYTLSLGSETTYVHTTQLDKYVYMAELRTGAGAHFKYAQNVLDSVEKLREKHPEVAAAIHVGEFEPE